MDSYLYDIFRIFTRLLMKKITISSDKLKKYENLLLDQNMLFELNAIPQIVVNKDRVIVKANKKFLSLFKYKAKDILGKQTVVLTPNKKKFKEYETHFIQTKSGTITSNELEYKKSDNTLFWVKLEGNQISQKKDEPLILWSFIDIDNEVKYREELKLLASVDPMTKLYNRRYFSEISESIFNLSKRDKTQTTVMILDIDKFKKINDTYGHKVGDDVIISTANILKTKMRKSDLVSRWGGEEFVVLLPQTDINGGMVIAEALRKTVENLIIYLKNKIKLKFTISIGLSEIDYKDKNIESSIRRADIALYKAKNSGRNKIKFISCNL